MEVVESVEQRLIDAVAARYLDPYFDVLIEEVNPPRFEAQRSLLPVANFSTRISPRRSLTSTAP